ncbi:hypothetical protein CHUAL_011772 [Chamberlinius hualienensis]
MAELLWSCVYCGRRKSSPEELERRAKSRQIDKLIEKDKQQYRRQVKILLLGAGESGKSTFIKQMKIIHGYHFEEEALREYRTIVYQNVIKGMKVLVDARNKLLGDVPWSTPSHRHLSELLMRSDNNLRVDTSQLFLAFVPTVRKLWQDPGIRIAYERRREYQLADAVKYFLDNIDRIGMSDYVPINQDILLARRATKGISELTVPIRGIPFLFVDVGGQRSQRQKWLQCFDSITSILFLVSSSEFDQVLLEDRSTNRLLESKNIFETIVNNRYFSEVSIILFLNKTDLLRQKLTQKDPNISMFFPTFSGNPYSLEDVQKFMVNLFDEVRRDRRKNFFYHFTTAIDTENIKVVFNAVRDTILSNNLKQLMLQ